MAETKWPEWRDIASAPKDGTEALFVVSGFRPAVGYWRTESNAFEYLWHDDLPSEETWQEHLSRGGVWEPTHWMPLPPPPTQTGDDNER